MNKTAIPAILLPLAAACTGNGDKAVQPNVVVLIADDISAADFGCYGSVNTHTPNIDRLASEGLMFNNAILSTSSSSPSRCSIITGRYPHNTGACELHTELPAEQTSIAKVLKASGYYTAQAGKWHFGEAEGGIREDFDVSGKGKSAEDGNSGAGQWISRLRERPSDRPFFMWLASFDAHRPWDKDSSMPRYNPDELQVSQFHVDDGPTRQDLANYYYEVSRFDRSVGEVVEELKAQGIYDNTMIIVMADNGRPFPRAKTRLITEGIRTPLIVRYPEYTRPGTVCNSLVSVIDIAATIADITGAPTPESFQGQSFKSLLANPEEPFRNYAFAEHNWHDYEAYERMVISEDYLLIENGRPELNAEGAIDIMGGGAGQSLLRGHDEGTLSPLQEDIFVTPRPRTELYRYNEDTDQIENLSATAAETLDELLGVLHEWQKATCDDLPDDLTPDWYDRNTMGALPAKNFRGTMPGANSNARACNEHGPF